MDNHTTLEGGEVTLILRSFAKESDWTEWMNEFCRYLLTFNNGNIENYGGGQSAGLSVKRMLTSLMTLIYALGLARYTASRSQQ
jgi:hypothetical protein